MAEQVITKQGQQDRPKREPRPVWEGTREELAQHAEELLASLPAGQSLRVYALGAVPAREGQEERAETNGQATAAPAETLPRSTENTPGAQHTSSYGKYAHILRPSEEFLREKQDEITREERRLR
jgi:hypothetical protein